MKYSYTSHVARCTLQDKNNSPKNLKKVFGHRSSVFGLKRGFTLIEILMVMVIFSIVGVAVASSFFSGIKIWDRARNVDFNYNNTLLTLEGMAKELRQTIVTSYIDFEGDGTTVSFATLRGNSTIKVTYQFESFYKELLRKEVSLGDIVAEKEDENVTERNILSCEYFTLEYFYFDQEKEQYVWLTEWEKENGVCSAIRIKMRVNGNDFSKTIFIPVA